MRFFAASSVFALSVLSVARATPSVQAADIEARDFAERALINVNLGTVNLDPIVLVGPTTCPPIVENGAVTLRTFAVVQVAQNVAADVTLNGLQVGGLLSDTADVTANVNADAFVCACVRLGVQTGLVDLPADLAAQALVGLAAEATAENLLSVAAVLNAAPVADVTLTPGDRQDCLCEAANQFPTCANGQCGCGTCDAGQIYNPSTGTCVLTPSALTRRRALSFGQQEPAHLRQARRADIVERLRRQQE